MRLVVMIFLHQVRWTEGPHMHFPLVLQYVYLIDLIFANVTIELLSSFFILFFSKMLSFLRIYECDL